MKLRFLTSVLFLAVVTPIALSQQPQPPLTKGQVMDLVKLGMSGADLAEKIKIAGIDFEPADDYLQALRNAGTQDVVIQALRAAGPKPLTREQVGKLVADGVPNQRAATLVKQRGIDFPADDEYLRALQQSGADETLIAAVREAGAAVRAAALAPSPGPVRENPKDGLKYVWIPPGTFMMGCSLHDTECYASEDPPHQVTITKGFWLGQTEVTVGAYKRFVRVTGRKMPHAPNFNSDWANDNMPVVDVAWNDARDYCTWAGGRLPTEAEWEYAARGGSTQARYGNLDEIAWYDGNSDDQPHAVAQKRANAYGLYDMLGNVWEWVNDWYDQNYFRSSPAQDPAGPVNGAMRTLRGGSWDFYPGDVRVSARFGDSPGNKDYTVLGFRCGGEVFAP
jgi:formylglycine-generating enzyme required for sulfatase activity